jgi:hypothetical protein
MHLRPLCGLTFSLLQRVAGKLRGTWGQLASSCNMFVWTMPCCTDSFSCPSIAYSLGRPGSRLRAIHSPCDSKPGGLVTEWVRRSLRTRLLELRLQAPVRWADLPGWFYHGKITVA